MMDAEMRRVKFAACLFGIRAVNARVALVRYSSFIVHHFAFKKKC
ncbi:MAG: hypothetical protein JWN13_5253 [Betaproteobacteria bacterium]|jgi:hypothetical protein|nr:hypothetical protein [Betaproteobacteria bacterium]MEA3157784.1 hypothetical protein [Betaproteobacteria bacterium]